MSKDLSNYPSKNQVILGLGEGPNTHLLVTDSPVKSSVSGTINNDPDNDILNILLEGTGVIRHEEHGPIVIEVETRTSGNRYHQQEYDFFAGTNTRVFD